MKRTIPESAKMLCKNLRKAGFSKKNPLRLKDSVHVHLVVNFPGNLEFEDWDVTALWPENGSVGIRHENGAEKRLENVLDDGGESDWWLGTSWNIDNLLKATAAII